MRQLSNKSVSWIRRRDAHILTVDRFTFIADERFQAFLVEATDTWTLQVILLPSLKCVLVYPWALLQDELGSLCKNEVREDYDISYIKFIQF